MSAVTITIWNAAGEIVVHETHEPDTATQEEIDEMVTLIEGGTISARDAAALVLADRVTS